MSNNKNSYNSSAGGIGFLGLLALLFITLKLTGFIDWSWWWVLSPLWIPTSIVLLIFVVMLIGVVITAVVKASKQTDGRKKK
jgi:Transmembrane Fragile-X-F protein.